MIVEVVRTKGSLFPPASSRETQEPENEASTFFDDINRPDLKEVIIPIHPWCYWTMELYRKDIKGGGGLGMLASDTLEIFKGLKIPSVFVTPFYRVEVSQEIENFEQQAVRREVMPEEKGFEKFGDITINTKNDPPTTLLNVYKKQEGTVTIFTITEPNFGELYQGENNCDHRLYQEVALGFGGYQLVKSLGIIPAMNQLNEAPTVFAALARFDEQVQQAFDLPGKKHEIGSVESEELDGRNGYDNGQAFLSQAMPQVMVEQILEGGLSRIRKDTLYTNHTLVKAVEAEFSQDQFEKYVIPNLKSVVVKNWLRGKIALNGGRMKLSSLAIELSGKKSGVSMIHTQEAEKVYLDYDGNKVNFEAVTNAIDLNRWGDPKLIDLYKKAGVLTALGLPSVEKIDPLDNETLRKIKDQARTRLRSYLMQRLDQYQEPVFIPKDAKIFTWRKRIAGYKRPGMLLDNPEKFAQFLKAKNIHIVMAGKAHQNDEPMKRELRKILETIDRNPVLKQRVHFIQDYDEDLSRALAHGADGAVNVPIARDENTGKRVCTEACGTSWEKDILGNTIVISTDDGGIADPGLKAGKQGDVNFDPSYLQVTGANYQEEVNCLYSQMARAASILDGRDREYSKEEFWKKQLKGYLPIIAGPKMARGYVELSFPLTHAA